MAESIKVGFVSIFYPLFMGRYLLEALLRRKDTLVYTAGPFTGKWIPWNGGMYLPDKYVFTPDHQMPFSPDASYAYSIVESHAPFEPDIWIEVNSTLRMMGRPKKGVYAVVATDPHVLNYAPQRAVADFFFNMQKPYLKPRDIWLPYGYDPIWHAETTIPASQRKWHAALLGLHYDRRTRLVNGLKNKGFNVKYELGPCYEDAREIYHNSICGLNWSSLQDTTARVFETMAYGIAPVLNRVPDLMELFVDRRDFLGFDTQDEAVQHVFDCVADRSYADQIGRAARKAVEPHTWDARIDQIFRNCGLVS
jgi:hypothetical protein